MGAVESPPPFNIKPYLLVGLLFVLLFPWEVLGTSFMKNTGHDHDKLLLGVSIGPVERPMMIEVPPLQPPSHHASSLPSGGGGSPDTLEWWEACRAAVDDPSTTLGLHPGPRLPDSFLPVKEIMWDADYTRNAVVTAWAEYLRSIPALASPHPHFSLLETSPDPELTTWDKYATLPYIDKCHYDGTGACDIHSLAVQRPLTAAQRADPNATTGHPKLTRAPYDLQLYSQTLEHLYDLPLAAERMYHLATPGGFVWISVPFWNIPHMRPSHQQGCSPCGLYGLLGGAGFDILKLGWYGHSNYSDYLARPGSHWPKAKELGFPDPFDTIPLPNLDAANTVWILAQRPLDEQQEGGRGSSSSAATTRVPLDPTLRPKLAFNEMFRCLDPNDGELIHSRPSPTTLLHLLNVFPSWLDADLANVVLAAVFHERVFPYAAASPLAIAGRTALAIAQGLLTPSHVRAWTSEGLSGLLAESRGGRRKGGGGGGSQRRVEQQQPQQAPTPPLPKAGFLSDLFEGFRDPLDTLRAFVLTVQPGSPILLSCRPGDAAFASRPTLGTCTADGFLQLLCRAGLTPSVQNYGAWGRIAYSRAALAEGHFISFRSYLPRVAEGRVHGEAEGEGAAAAASESFARELQATPSLEALLSKGGKGIMAQSLDALAAHVLNDVAGEAAFSWPAVTFAIVEGWSLPLVPHYALSNDTLWHTV